METLRQTECVVISGQHVDRPTSLVIIAAPHKPTSSTTTKTVSRGQYGELAAGQDSQLLCIFMSLQDVLFTLPPRGHGRIMAQAL